MFTMLKKGVSHLFWQRPAGNGVSHLFIAVQVYMFTMLKNGVSHLFIVVQAYMFTMLKNGVSHLF
ncbi:MAG: hypothetical protein LBH97_07730, partial [Treponema sp.]|nr:hypothetical protein [Treponema sp.]